MTDVMELATAFLSRFYLLMLLLAVFVGALMRLKYKGFGLFGVAMLAGIDFVVLKVQPGATGAVVPLCVAGLAGYLLVWAVQGFFG